MKTLITVFIDTNKLAKKIENRAGVFIILKNCTISGEDIIATIVTKNFFLLIEERDYNSTIINIRRDLNKFNVSISRFRNCDVISVSITFYAVSASVFYNS